MQIPAPALTSLFQEQRKTALPLIKAFQREVDECRYCLPARNPDLRLGLPVPGFHSNFRLCRDRERAIGAALVHIFGQIADLPGIQPGNRIGAGDKD